MTSKGYSVALAGNPNAGKTTLFNALTGAHRLVANYPGVTVERTDGSYIFDGMQVKVTDLPGTYSLTAYSPEERIARDVIFNEAPDVIVCVADASNIERNLYLLVQLMEMEINLVLALNISDEAKKRGQRMDIPKLREILGFPVVETIGRTGQGAVELRAAIHEARLNPRTSHRLGRDEDIDPLLDVAAALLPARKEEGDPPPRWTIVKLVEEDPEETNRVALLPDGRIILDAARRTAREIETRTGQAPATAFAARRVER